VAHGCSYLCQNKYPPCIDRRCERTSRRLLRGQYSEAAAWSCIDKSPDSRSLRTAGTDPDRTTLNTKESNGRSMTGCSCIAHPFSDSCKPNSQTRSVKNRGNAMRILCRFWVLGFLTSKAREDDSTTSWIFSLISETARRSRIKALPSWTVCSRLCSCKMCDEIASF
jgi:hypothetical protein